jgi:hypothetical protein
MGAQRTRARGGTEGIKAMQQHKTPQFTLPSLSKLSLERETLKTDERRK